MKRFLEQASRLIAIDSTTERGNEELVNYISVLMQNRGLKTTLQNVMHSIEHVSKRQFNVVGILGSTLSDRKIKKGLLLLSHLDTVKPGLQQQWDQCEGNPLNANISENRIVGLGAADAKIDFLAKLYAIHKYRERNLKMPVYLAGTCGEEMGMFGAKFLLQSYLLNPQYVVVGKPTDLQLVNRHKGIASYSIKIGYHVVERGARGFNRRVRLYANGQSCHSGDPKRGRNAIDGAMEFLNKAIENGFEIKFTRLEGGSPYHQTPDQMLADFCLTSHQVEDFRRFFNEMIQSSRGKKNQFRMELGGLGDAGIRFLPDVLFSCVKDVFQSLSDLSEELSRQEDSCYDPPTNTLSLSSMHQGAQETALAFDIRYLPETPIHEVLKRIEQNVAGIASKYPNLNMSIRQERGVPGLMYGGDFTHLALDILTDLKMHQNAECSSFCSEASLYAQKGYDVIVFGPGHSLGNVHSPNESVNLPDIEKAISFYERLIEKVCL